MNGYLTFACVLKSGGPYNHRDAIRLERAIARHYAEPFSFVCLTDTPFHPTGAPRLRVFPLRENWPGFWAKMELFRPDLFGMAGARVLYFDLDTIICGRLEPIAAAAESAPLVMLRDFYRPEHYGSGVMGFRARDFDFIYEQFKKAPAEHIHRTSARYGDQNVIEQMAPGAAFFQDVVPGHILSYKVHCGQALEAAPAGASLICFHGIPKPWDLTLPWVQDYWEQ